MKEELTLSIIDKSFICCIGLFCGVVILLGIWNLIEMVRYGINNR